MQETEMKLRIKEQKWKKKKKIMKCAINFNNWKYNWTVVHA